MLLQLRVDSLMLNLPLPTYSLTRSIIRQPRQQRICKTPTRLYSELRPMQEWSMLTFSLNLMQFSGHCLARNGSHGPSYRNWELIRKRFPILNENYEESGNEKLDERRFLNPSPHSEIFRFFYRKRFASFASFFLDSLIDVPTCFTVSSSIYRLRHNNFLLKLMSSNLKCGQLEKINSMMSRVLFALTWKEEHFLNPHSLLPLLDILTPHLLLRGEISTKDPLIVCGNLKEEGGEEGGKLLQLSEAEIDQLRAMLHEDVACFPNQSWLTSLVRVNVNINEGSSGNDNQNESRIGGEFRIFNKDRTKRTDLVLSFETTPEITLVLQYGHYLTKIEKEAAPDNRLLIRLGTIFQQINPVFNFFSYKTSKTIWKFSRGKAGRYFFMWKFIPPHKRELLILQWLKHEFALASSKQSAEKFKIGLERLLSFDNTHPFARRKRFINNFIFREYRFSLMRNFRTRK